MIDWYNIKENYPKSFERFIAVMFPNLGVPCLNSLSLFDLKKLYKFFDDDGVYLNIEMYNKNQWFFTISLKNGYVVGNGNMSRQTREEIEVDGFKECFKMLEKKLEVVYE
jgi:hypothetical protein